MGEKKIREIRLVESMDDEPTLKGTAAFMKALRQQNDHGQKVLCNLTDVAVLLPPSIGEGKENKHHYCSPKDLIRLNKTLLSAFTDEELRNLAEAVRGPLAEN